MCPHMLRSLNWGRTIRKLNEMDMPYFEDQFQFIHSTHPAAPLLGEFGSRGIVSLTSRAPLILACASLESDHIPN